MGRGDSLSPEVSWSRSKGNIEISASTERSILSNPIGRVQGRGTKKSEEEEPTRKRIRVACSRCRKRKIKCSGPIGGDDQPCLNCKNAGANTSCAFELAGSLKVDLGGLRYPSKGYLYGISDDVHGTMAYPNEHHTYSLGSNILQYPAATYPGTLRQERDGHHSYAISYNENQDYCDYGQQASTYDGYPPYSTASAMLQIPSQTHAANGSQDHLASWSQDFHTNCNTYDDSTQPISRPPLALTAQRSLASSSGYSSTLNSTVSSTIPERVLPKPKQIPLPSPVPSILLPSDTREQLHWSEDYESQTDSLASRRSSQDTSPDHSSLSHSSLLEQDINSSMGSGIYSVLPPSTPETPLSLSVPINAIQQPAPYVQHQASNKYQYHYSTLKPSSNSMSVAATTIDAASLASIGNHTFTHLPYRTVDKCGTLQYQVHNGVRKAPSRIAVEVASGGGRRIDN